jgi:hypothetical protein
MKEDLFGFFSNHKLKMIEEYSIRSVMGNGKKVVDLVVLAQKE